LGSSGGGGAGGTVAVSALLGFLLSKGEVERMGEIGQWGRFTSLKSIVM